MMKVESPNRIPIEELHAAVGQVLSRHFRGPIRVCGLRRRFSAYSSSCAIENLHVSLNRMQPLRLVLKDLSPSAQLEAARQIRPDFLYQPGREIQVYERILTKRMGTAVFYGAVRNGHPQQRWLLLERVEGSLLWQHGRMEAWESAARWLAGIHNYYGREDTARMHHEIPELAHYDQSFLEVWPNRAEKFLRREPGRQNASLRRRFNRLIENYDTVVQRIVSLPFTFVHGEFYPSNILLRRTGHRSRICPVDWELAGVGPGLLDLAALTSGNWSTASLGRMVKAYRDALEPGKDSPPPLSELIESVQYCQLHLAVQMLGWAADWSPPPMHAQNWLHRALRLADKLGIKT